LLKLIVIYTVLPVDIMEEIGRAQWRPYRVAFHLSHVAFLVLCRWEFFVGIFAKENEDRLSNPRTFQHAQQSETFSG